MGPRRHGGLAGTCHPNSRPRAGIHSSEEQKVNCEAERCPAERQQPGLLEMQLFEGDRRVVPKKAELGRVLGQGGSQHRAGQVPLPRGRQTVRPPEGPQPPHSADGETESRGGKGSTPRPCFQVPSLVSSQPCSRAGARMEVGASPRHSPIVTVPSLPPRSLASPLNLHLPFTTGEKRIIEQTLISALALVEAPVSAWPRAGQRWGGGKVTGNGRAGHNRSFPRRRGHAGSPPQHEALDDKFMPHALQ